ncbi:MAG: cohesin domain-containing protein [Saprospiraceae bacterium]|nr:cohesin domain-containing protein [Saprospiraceae bacterium]
MFLSSRWVWAFIFLLGFPTLHAQKKVTFILPIVNNVNPGAVVNMPVKVVNFDSIAGVQFVLQWNPDVLNYLAVLNFNLPGLVSNNFNTNETSEGILRFSWSTANVRAGVSLPDSSAIFLIKFSAKGQNGQGTPVIFTEIPPTAFEVTKAGNPFTPPPLRMEDCVLHHGYVAIGFAVHTEELPEGSSSLLVQTSPNPFTDRTVVTFDLSSAEEVDMVLSDATGRIVKTQHYALPAGRHGIEIAASQLPQRGFYFLLLRTRSQSSIQPLVRL